MSEPVDNTTTFTRLLREYLAVNAHDESDLRCTCGDCIAEARKPLVALYADLADASRYLPLDPAIMPGGPVVGEMVVERFRLALHRLHVAVST